ncbi:MAG: S8 family serine peptidase, partial [Oscillospiraceae bacterium]|nr:S8 family serine peptidase [Oscillospiraceae bacterium]
MMNAKPKKYIALLLALIFVIVPLAGCNGTAEVPTEAFSDHAPDSIKILTQTLQSPMGLQGFALGWNADPNELVEIGVQFATPPAVALRLMREEEQPLLRSSSESDFEEQAQKAHETFWADFDQQIAERTRTASQVEVISEHYWLFNGVFLRAPVYMVEQIALLPEVFVVTPKEEHEPPDPIVYDTDLIMAVGGDPDPLMAGARALFNMDYIHNDLLLPGRTEPGLRGGQMRCNRRDPCGGCGEHTRPVRVAIIDSQINYAHERFQDFLDPTTGRLRGEQRTIDPARGHGTQVAGPLIAMAPEVELWNFSTGTAGIEAAHRVNVDVMNMSVTIGTLFNSARYAISLAVLDGIVFVTGAGNGGHLGSFSVSGQSGLFITAGSGQAGSDRPGFENRDGISDFSSRGPDHGMFHIGPDILAPGNSVMTLDHSGSGYIRLGGTSLSSPVVAGIAALMVEAFPDAPPHEIGARMMNTARQLSAQEDNSVFNIGAGFIQPYYALTSSSSFATVQNYIQWGDHTIRGTFRKENFSSLSFGAVREGKSIPLTVTIHNPGSGTWVPEVRYNDHLHDHSGVSLHLLDFDSSGDTHTFTYQMRFADHVPRGLYEGNIIFTNATQGRTITMPFGAYLGAEPIRIELTPNGDHDFGTMYIGEQSPAALSLNLRNIGDEILSFTFFGLTGSHADSFVLSTSSAPMLHPNQSANVTVMPREGLAVGTHIATVRVFNTSTSHRPVEPPQFFDVSVTVLDPASARTVTFELDGVGTSVTAYPNHPIDWNQSAEAQEIYDTVHEFATGAWT